MKIFCKSKSDSCSILLINFWQGLKIFLHQSSFFDHWSDSAHSYMAVHNFSNFTRWNIVTVGWKSLSELHRELPGNLMHACHVSTHTCTHARTYTHTLSGTTRMSWYQKKHSPTRAYPNHQSSIICDPWHPPCSIYVPGKCISEKFF